MTASPSAPLSTVWGEVPLMRAVGAGGVGQGVGVDREVGADADSSPLTLGSVRGLAVRGSLQATKW